jgi:hypothetical protein
MPEAQADRQTELDKPTFMLIPLLIRVSLAHFPDFFIFIFYIKYKKSAICVLYLVYLKVPKREIFDRSDFPDFYTMKSLRVGDFRVKVKKIFTNI